MKKINAYLSFNGNCREAMTFYKECLGGTLNMQTVGDSPMADKMPPETKNHIMHASLEKDGIFLMASDLMNGQPVNGNTIALLIDCSSEEEINSLFSKFSTGGKTIDPLADTFWGAKFGALTDKFGIRWLFNYDKQK